MKILWLAGDPPTHPLTGVRERARYMLTYLAARHEVYLLTFAGGEARQELQTIPGLAHLTTLPFGQIGTMRQLIARIIAKWHPDVIHTQNFGLHPLVPPGERQVLDPHDMPHPSVLATKGKYYFDAVERCAATILVSEEEREKLPPPLRPKALVLPNGVDVDYWAQAAAQPPEAATLLFPGAMNWEPNITAALSFSEQAWPRICAAVPQARLVFAGYNPAAEVLALSQTNARIQVAANPADMRPYFSQASVMIVPILKATGTRLKILQALAAGRPVVSTPVGAEGLQLTPGQDLLIAPPGESFVQAVTGLLLDGEKRAALARAGRQAVEQYRWERLLPLLESLYPS
ncbi:MAG: glycosyltransferase family 4 protein [Chloroflexota bacterium]